MEIPNFLWNHSSPGEIEGIPGSQIQPEDGFDDDGEEDEGDDGGDEDAGPHEEVERPEERGRREDPHPLRRHVGEKTKVEKGLGKVHVVDWKKIKLLIFEERNK